MMALVASRIVVPVDFSGESDHAIATALSIAGGDATKLHLVHVMMPLDSISPGVLVGDVTDKHRAEAVQTNLNELAHECDAGKATKTVLIGNAGLELAEYAREIGSDLIVIPSHGYHGMKRMFLGSVAERVIRHANCSVLVLRRSDAE